MRRRLRCRAAGGLLVLLAVGMVAALSSGPTPVAAADGVPTIPPLVPTPQVGTFRLLSSPDFLNADVADLGQGPNFWTPGRSRNGTSTSYERVIDRILDDWAARDPAAVLIAGDTVNGRWGRDGSNTGNFGPVETPAQSRAAVRMAAATYYPQFLQRFSDHGLDVFASTGDHEYGDNDWSPQKRALARTFAHEFGRYFTRSAGVARFPDHPGGRHAMTAYAWRPDPDVQVVSIDVFDITRRSARLRVDAAQMRWLKGVLKRARRDGVTWVVVQGHVPILSPVRASYSSRLHYEGGHGSRLWKVFRKYGVDVYLCGEVHAVTATTRDHILQLAHGGAFQFGLTNYALLDFAKDRLRVTLNDYRLRIRNAPDRARIWETVRRGLKKVATLNGGATTIGTLTLSSSGAVSERTGILRPYRG